MATLDYAQEALSFPIVGEQGPNHARRTKLHPHVLVLTVQAAQPAQSSSSPNRFETLLHDVTDWIDIARDMNEAFGHVAIWFNFRSVPQPRAGVPLFRNILGFGR